ncbi:hypothetical protein Hypma_004611 [Hypsizygus marmoreus]|uniref:F-box domain-containing protein n=1 Tax=Hypsizygus marmoreus TaxID=39966 RepID=A0A369K3E7_HYPMA|nr:hypothetical protein Hypma_004611 [Hypsizygus marmoreus]
MSVTFSITSLPVETLDEIIENTGTNDLQILLRVCKSLNTLATRHLYRNVTLTSPVDAVIFFKTIKKRCLAAMSIRSIILLYTLAESAIQCIELLTTLDEETPFSSALPGPNIAL